MIAVRGVPLSRPQDSSAMPDHQQQHGVPHLDRIGDEEETPSARGNNEQQHAALNDAARIDPVGEPANRDREQQERQPVRQHRKARQRRRMEFLEHHPITDHMLNIIGHHRQHVSDELEPVRHRLHRRERAGRDHGVLGKGVQAGTWVGLFAAYTFAVERSRHLGV
ncbi:hypothetical protein ABIB90_002974 [Bradyrhizobium sp. JR4.1]